MKNESVVFSICLPKHVASELDAVAEATALKRSEVLRQALRFGMPEVSRRYCGAGGASETGLPKSPSTPRPARKRAH